MTVLAVAESVVERVARAIYEEDDPWHKAWPWGQSRDGIEDKVRGIARAAIAAMPRPIEDETPTDTGGKAAVETDEFEREYLLLASYCGTDTPGCSNKTPCADCLAMCNVYDGKGGAYLRELGKNPTPTDTGLLSELVEARAEIERLRGLLIDPGSPPWENARAILVAEMRKAEMHDHAAWVADGGAAFIPSHIALNLIAHAAKAPLTGEPGQ